MAVFIENQLHERVGEVLDDPDESFMRVCEAGPRRSVRHAVDRHGDTMLNAFQLALLLEELRELPADLRTETVRAVEEAAEVAIRRHGYLFFSGD
ncbi:hypothetical protein ACH4PU_25615 [Streptomyces sp. NPDC021100]|uniref:hypothetical protein n=1 Tax=Streptomyces sp. NPDC021100 TaxID=3365114 RepID=UPI00378CDACE